MTLFDAPNRDFCATKRTLTSSPLQSLALLNNPEFIEAGRVLAEKTLTKNYNSENELLTEIFRKVTSRCPSENELNTLKKYYTIKIYLTSKLSDPLYKFFFIFKNIFREGSI